MFKDQMTQMCNKIGMLWNKNVQIYTDRESTQETSGYTLSVCENNVSRR